MDSADGGLPDGAVRTGPTLLGGADVGRRTVSRDGNGCTQYFDAAATLGGGRGDGRAATWRSGGRQHLSHKAKRSARQRKSGKASVLASGRLESTACAERLERIGSAVSNADRYKLIIGAISQGQVANERTFNVWA